MLTHRSFMFIFFLLFSASLLSQDRVQEYYDFIHQAEEQLMNDEFEDAYFNYLEAFNINEGFAQDLVNASFAMLNSEPDIHLLCEWNNQYFEQTGQSLIPVFKSKDVFTGSELMSKLTPDNWIDLEVCNSKETNHLQESFFQMLLNDSTFSMNWTFKNGRLDSKKNGGLIHNNSYALYDILPLNRFIVSDNFNQREAGAYVMSIIEKLMQRNLNLNISPLLRAMKYKVKRGEMDNRYFSLLYDNLAIESYQLRNELFLEDDQFYYTHHCTYDDLETFHILDGELLEEVDQRRKEIYLFDYNSSIKRIAFYREHRLYFPYYKSLNMYSLSNRKNKEIQLKLENKELIVLD